MSECCCMGSKAGHDQGCPANLADNTSEDIELVCMNGHDLCYMGPSYACPYCEKRGRDDMKFVGEVGVASGGGTGSTEGRKQVCPTIPYKYNEPALIRQLQDYVDRTYGGHYVGKDNVQSMDLIIASGHGIGFTAGNVTKYAMRYGKKGGRNRDDILKAIHYGLLMLYIHDRNEPTAGSGGGS